MEIAIKCGFQNVLEIMILMEQVRNKHLQVYNLLTFKYLQGSKVVTMIYNMLTMSYNILLYNKFENIKLLYILNIISNTFKCIEYQVELSIIYSYYILL